MDEKLYKLVKDDIIYKGTNLEYCLKELEITHLSKNTISTCFWEYIRKANSSKYIQTIGCISYLKPEKNIIDFGELTIILVEKYRLPVERKVLEFPSSSIDEVEYNELVSLIDKIENIKDIDFKSKIDSMLNNVIANFSLKVLNKNTGFTGEFKSIVQTNNNIPCSKAIFKNIYFSPWISSENCSFVLLEIDKSKKENVNISANSQKNKLINTHEVKVKDLLDFIMNKVNKENYSCSAYLFYFAFGLMFKDIFKDYLQ